MPPDTFQCSILYGDRHGAIFTWQVHGMHISKSLLYYSGYTTPIDFESLLESGEISDAQLNTLIGNGWDQVSIGAVVLYMATCLCKIET